MMTKCTFFPLLSMVFVSCSDSICSCAMSVFVGENTLRLLEARKGEKEAQAFVKLRRQREKKSQEA